jgi:hypothetical protein
MKKNNDYYYSGITSLEDLRLEKARLILKTRIIESRINMNLIQIREEFSFQVLAMSVVKELILPKILDIISNLTNTAQNEDESE